MIRLESIDKEFPFGRGSAVPVLQGLDLELGGQGVTAIRGASGSGKTTLLNLIGGLDRPTRGRVLVDGEDRGGWSPAALAAWRNRRIGFVFQSYHLLPELTVLENVALPAWMGRRDGIARARELVAQVGLEARAAHRPGELSGGEQQRAAVARALVNDPDLILADEPTGNLDAGNREAVLDLLLALSRQSQKALVLVTHDDAVARRAARVLELRDGRLHERFQ